MSWWSSWGLVVFWVVMAGWFAGLAWAVKCNKRTYTEKSLLLDRIDKLPDPFRAIELMEMTRTVTYDQHYRARLFGRNPWALYPKPLTQFFFGEVSYMRAMKRAGIPI